MTTIYAILGLLVTLLVMVLMAAFGTLAGLTLDTLYRVWREK